MLSPYNVRGESKQCWQPARTGATSSPPHGTAWARRWRNERCLGIGDSGPWAGTTRDGTVSVTSSAKLCAPVGCQWPGAKAGALLQD